MSPDSSNPPSIERVRVLTEKKDGTTEGYLVESVSIRKYLDQGGRMTFPGMKPVEVAVDIIIVTERGELTCKPHPTIGDCFLFVNEIGREFPLLYDYVSDWAYSVWENFVIASIDFWVIQKIVLVTIWVITMGVPEHIEKTRGRILQTVSS